jgi:hypothetical protein
VGEWVPAGMSLAARWSCIQGRSSSMPSLGTDLDAGPYPWIDRDGCRHRICGCVFRRAAKYNLQLLELYAMLTYNTNHPEWDNGLQTVMGLGSRHGASIGPVWQHAGKLHRTGVVNSMVWRSNAIALT